MGLINNAFWLTKGINGIKAKKDGVWTKYDFDVSKWIWGKEEEKLWVLKELWIWLKHNISKQSGKKIMGIEQTMDFGISTETKNSRQKRDRGIEQTLDFGISKETKN